MPFAKNGELLSYTHPFGLSTHLPISLAAQLTPLANASQHIIEFKIM